MTPSAIDELEKRITAHFDGKIDHLRELVTLRLDSIVAGLAESKDATGKHGARLAACEMKGADLEHKIEAVRQHQGPITLLVVAVGSILAGVGGWWAKKP